MHIQRSSNSIYIIVGSCNSYLTTCKHWTCHLLNIAGLQHSVPSNQPGAYVRDKDTSANFALKCRGVGAYARGGAYLWDTMILVNG